MVCITLQYNLGFAAGIKVVVMVILVVAVIVVEVAVVMVVMVLHRCRIVVSK